MSTTDSSDAGSSKRFPLLFGPTQLNGLPLRNRLVVGPMTRISATEDGRATAAMADYYAAFAHGGFALLTTEAAYVDEAWSQGWPNQPGMANAAQRQSWAPVVDAVHTADTPIMMQLYHAGALSEFNRWRSDTIGPSPVRPPGEQSAWFRGSGQYRIPRAITLDEMAAVKDAFCAAAAAAIDIGFDGVEVHGSNGYLLDQFLTGYSNHRDDDYGGPLANRLRFPLEILTAVRAVVPADKIVGISISLSKSNNPGYLWPLEDAEGVFQALGRFDNIYVRVHGLMQGSSRLSDPMAGTTENLPAIARRNSGRPIIAYGALDDPDIAESMLARGEVDFIGLSRAALADPQWPTRVQAGEAPIRFAPEALIPNASLETTAAWRAGLA